MYVFGQDDWLFFARDDNGVLIYYVSECSPAWLDAPHRGEAAYGTDAWRTDNAYMHRYVSQHAAELYWRQADTCTPDTSEDLTWPLADDPEFAASSAQTYLPRPTVRKVSSALQAGDIVAEHGMRVRLDTLRSYPCENKNHDGCGPTIYAWSGTVINMLDARAAGIIPRSFLFDNDRHSRGPGHGREDQWTVQGNDLATWPVEVTVPQARIFCCYAWLPYPQPGQEITCPSCRSVLAVPAP